jgi:hypothetical protein
MRAEMEAEIERVRKSFKAELVPYKATTDLIRADDVRPGGARSASSASPSSARVPAPLGRGARAYCITEGSGPGRRDRWRSSLRG